MKNSNEKTTKLRNLSFFLQAGGCNLNFFCCFSMVKSHPNTTHKVLNIQLNPLDIKIPVQVSLNVELYQPMQPGGQTEEI